VTALREAARRLGPGALADATVFCTREPCPMCVGALLESDVGALVYAVPNIIDGAAGTVIQLAQHPGLGRRLQVVSGIRQAEAEELFATHRGREPRAAERAAGLPDEGLAARA
jgi:tRNA(adenine34) deaminase